MDVSIAICTWNRASRLNATLEQICNLQIPRGLRWELLVVDNNSTDETPAVVERYANRLPIRRLIESELGLSNARNRAVGEASGELLLWTDDDVLVAPDWLIANVAAAERWPNAGYFGGVIVPWYENEPPAWYRMHERFLEPVIAEKHDLAAIERPFVGIESPWGANMAFRRSAYLSTKFDPRLGRRGTDRTDSEDNAYCRALGVAGYQGVWVPTSKVKHLVGAERLTLSFVRRTFVGRGVTEVRLNPSTNGIALILGIPRWLLREITSAQLRYLWQRATRQPAWLRSFAAAARARGALTEHWRRRNQNALAT